MQGCACVGVGACLPATPSASFCCIPPFIFLFTCVLFFPLSFCQAAAAANKVRKSAGGCFFFFKSGRTRSPAETIPTSHLAIREANQACNLFSSACVLHLYPVSSLPA